MVLKIALGENEHISSATVNGELLPGYFEDQGFGFLYLPPLKKEKYTLAYTLGREIMPRVVYNDGTYNVYSLSQKQNECRINIRVYGSQIVKVKCAPPQKVTSDNRALTIGKTSYEQQTQTLSIAIKANDFQGCTGNITLLE